MSPFFGIGGTKVKIIEAIERVDALKFNPYTNAEKIAWLDRLDRAIKAQVIDTHYGGDECEFSGYTVTTNMETELLVPAPYDEIYLRWLEAQIDYQNGEYDKYNASISLYNTVFEQYAYQYNRQHHPKGNTRRFYF